MTGGIPPGCFLHQPNKKTIRKLMSPDGLYVLYELACVYLLPCAAGAALSAYEYLFLLDLVLCRVVYYINLHRFYYCT